MIDNCWNIFSAIIISLYVKKNIQVHAKKLSVSFQKRKTIWWPLTLSVSFLYMKEYKNSEISSKNICFFIFIIVSRSFWVKMLTSWIYFIRTIGTFFAWFSNQFEYFAWTFHHNDIVAEIYHFSIASEIFPLEYEVKIDLVEEIRKKW